MGGPAMRMRDEELAGVGGGELTAERASPLRGKWRAGCGRQPSVDADQKAIDTEGARIGGADLGADEMGAIRTEEHVTGIRRGRQRHSGAGERRKMAAGVEREAGVVAVRRPVALVGDVDQIAVYGDADWLDAARRDRPSAYSAQLAIGTDAQHGNLVAASIGGHQIDAVPGG